jgi:transcriptional regulator with XRE-family HTH domain
VEPSEPLAGDWFDPDVTTFGDRLAGAREGVGMTQAALARRLGIKVATLRSWEEDRSEPRANRIQMLSGLLNVSLVWLMTGEGEGASIAPSDDGDLLRQIGRARREALALSERLSVLEARLRARLDE